MHNLDVYKFIEKINKFKIDNKSLDIVKDLVLDLSESKENDLIIDIVNLENVNRNFFKKNKEENNNECNDKFCSICQDNIKKGEHKSQLCDCKHTFHKKCLNKYLKIQKTNFECPVCRCSYKKLLYKIADNSCNL